MTIRPRLPTCLVATAVALSNQRTVAAAITSLDEDFDKHSRNDKLSSLFDLQKQLLAELRGYLRGARAAEGAAAEESPPEGGDLRPGRDASTEHEKFLREKYPELADDEHGIRLSMRINLVLIGFQGEDDDLVNVPHETLELWLEHLPSVVRHATTAPGSYPAGGSLRSSSADETAPVDVEYVYRYHVVDVARKVRDAMEAHMRANLREEDEGPRGLEDGSPPPPRPTEGDDGPPPSDSDGGGGERSNCTKKGRLFMPSWRMEEFLGSLAIELQTEAWRDEEGEDARPAAYTFFVLNPRRAWISPGGDSRGSSVGNDPTYGYRCALSPGVMESLAADPEVVRWAEEMERSEQIRWRVVDGIDKTASGMGDFVFEDELFDSPPGRGGQDSPRAVIDRIDRTDASYRWAAGRLASLPVDGLAAKGTEADDGGSHSPRAWDVSVEKALLLRGDPGVVSPLEGRARMLLRDVLEKHKSKGSGASGETPSATGSACLTDSWVSGERFAWVDLQAGPFEWGPASGGDGFKSASSKGLLRWDRVSPTPSVFWEERLVGADGAVGGERGDDPRLRALDKLRGRLSARIDRLAALEDNMACGNRLLSDDEREQAAGRSNGDRRLGEGAGAVGVACEEVSAQLEFLRDFQVRERQVTSAADVAAAEVTEAAAHDSVLEVKKDTGYGAEGFADALRALLRSHVALLEEVLGELAPATKSDSRKAAWKASGTSGSTSPGSTSPGLRVESQALLARLAALVSSLARTVITPPSALPLPLPPSPRGNSNNSWTITAALRGEQETRLQLDGHGGEGGEGLCPNSRLSHHRASPPYRLPTGPALTLRARHGGLDKISMATASRHASSAHPLLSPPRPPLALEFFVPEDLAFTLYIVRAQGLYPPLGAPSATPSTQVDGRKKNRVEEGKEREEAGQPGRSDGGAVERSSGFDLPAFQAGAMSLKLPNQRASFTVHQVAASADPTLASALAGATRESMVNVVTPRGEPRVERRVSIDSAKIRHQLRARVEDEDTEAAAAAATEQARRHTRHITIFLFSLAGPESVYVDELWRARAVGGDMVVIAQSEQRRDHAPPLVCNGRAVEEDPRNPLRQALAALGSTVGGLVPSQHSWHEARGGGVVVDWRWSMSESPMSPVVPHAQFSQLDQDVIYRTHVVRALSASAELTRAGSTVLRNALSRETYRKILEGPLSDSLEKTRASLRDVSGARADVMRKVDTMAFDLVVRKLNPLLDMSRRCYEDALRLDSEVIAASRRLAGLDRTTAGAVGGASPLWGLERIDPTRLVVGLLIALSILAAWLLRRASRSPALFRRSRHRKDVKIN